MSDVGSDDRHHSQLLLLRLWTEDVAGGRSEWCGKVQHVISGRAGSFRGFPALEDLLADFVSAVGRGHDPTAKEARSTGGARGARPRTSRSQSNS